MIRPARGDDTGTIASILERVKADSVYGALPSTRGGLVRQVALVLAQEMSWVREEEGKVVAFLLASSSVNIYGMRIMAVQSVCGKGGAWLIRQAIEAAKRLGFVGVVFATSRVSDEALFSRLMQRAGAERSGTLYSRVV